MKYENMELLHINYRQHFPPKGIIFCDETPHVLVITLENLSHSFVHVSSKSTDVNILDALQKKSSQQQPLNYTDRCPMESANPSRSLSHLDVSLITVGELQWKN